MLQGHGISLSMVVKTGLLLNIPLPSPLPPAGEGTNPVGSWVRQQGGEAGVEQIHCGITAVKSEQDANNLYNLTTVLKPVNDCTCYCDS